MGCRLEPRNVKCSHTDTYILDMFFHKLDMYRNPMHDPMHVQMHAC